MLIFSRKMRYYIKSGVKNQALNPRHYDPGIEAQASHRQRDFPSSIGDPAAYRGNVGGKRFHGSTTLVPQVYGPAEGGDPCLLRHGRGMA